MSGNIKMDKLQTVLKPVWIVTRNGVIDEVFDNEAAAVLHRKNLIRGWNVTDIVMKDIKTLF